MPALSHRLPETTKRQNPVIINHSRHYPCEHAHRFESRKFSIFTGPSYNQGRHCRSHQFPG